MADDFWNSSDNLAAVRPIHYRSRNELDELTTASSKNDSLRKNEEQPIYARRKKLSQSFDFESHNNDSKKLHYFDYNQQRKYSDESYKKKYAATNSNSTLQRNGNGV